MPLKTALAITGLIFTSACSAIHTASKPESSPVAELRKPVSAALPSRERTEEKKRPADRFLDRPADPAASVDEADLVARYGASRVKKAKQITAKTAKIMGDDGFMGIMSKVGTRATRELYTELSDGIALSGKQQVKLKRMLEEVWSRDALACEKITGYFKTNASLITETTLAADALKRGVISKEDYQAVCARSDGEERKLEEELKDLKFATDVGSLMKDEDFAPGFTASLNSAQKARLKELQAASKEEAEDSPAESVKSLTGGSDSGQTLEEAEKKLDQAARAISTMKRMLWMLEKLGG